DPGYHILRVVTGEVINPLGLALTHPLHHWLGRLAVRPGWGEPAYAVTLVSAVFAAIAVANVFGGVWTLTGSRTAAWWSAASLATAHTFWQMATRAECYTVSAALLSAEWWCVAVFARSGRARYVCAALLLNGLGLANHNLALLTLPLLVIVAVHGFRRGRMRPGHLLMAAGLWLIGSLPYTGLVVAQWLESGDLQSVLRSALFGRSFEGRVLGAGLSLRLVGLSVGYIGFNFPNLLLPAAAFGAIKAGQLGISPLFRWPVLGALLVHTGFVLRYDVPDQYMFFVPVYVLICILGGIGFAAFIRSPVTGPRRAFARVAVGLVILTPPFYAAAASIARRYDLLASVDRHKPYRDDYTYVLIPWSVSEDSADRLSRDAVRLAGPGGLIIVEDLMASYAVRYRAMSAEHPQPAVVSPEDTERITTAATEHRTVVLVPQIRDHPRTPCPLLGAWQTNGQLYVMNQGFVNRSAP
ncbi:MAG: protein O-mannosyl-transferase family, partial [Phycisphaerae bacterium]